MNINEIYLTLRKQRLCKDGQDFSIRYLGKNKSYYSVIKARSRKPSTGVMMHLYFKLQEQAGLIQDDNLSVLYHARQNLLKMSSDVIANIKLQSIP